MKSVLNGKIRVTLRTGQTDQSLSFDKPTLTLGRAPDSDVFISDSKVSKKHLSIVFENGFIKIKDLSSSNGTFINGHRIIANNYILVTEDDVIRVGNIDSSLKIKYEPRPEKVAPPQFIPADPDKNTQAIFPAQVDESLEQIISNKIESKLNSEDQKISHNFKNLEIMRPMYENPTKHAQEIIAEANNIKKTILKNADIKSDLILNEAHKKANKITEEKIAEYKKNVEYMLQSAQIESEKIKAEALGKAYELKSEAEKMLAESLEESRNLVSQAEQRVIAEQKSAEQKIAVDRLAFYQSIDAEKQKMNDEINKRETARLDVVYREKIFAKYQEIETEMAHDLEKHKKDMESLDSEIIELNNKKQSVLDFLKNNQTIFDEKNNEIIRLESKINDLISENKKVSDLLEAKNKELVQISDLKEKNEKSFVEQKTKGDALLIDLKNKTDALALEKQTAKDSFDKVIAELHLKKEELKKVEEKIVIDRKMAFKNLIDEVGKKRNDENEKLEEFKKQQAKEFQKINDHNLKLFEKIGIDISHDIAQKLEVQFQKKGRFTFNEAVETISHSMNSHLALSSKDQKQELKVEEKIQNWQNQQKKKTYQTYLNALVIYGFIFWGGGYLKDKLSQDPMAEQRRELASKAQEAVEKNKYEVPQTEDYYVTYVDNTLYNKYFYSVYMNTENQSEWHKLATKHLLKKWKVSEEKAIEVIAGSKALVQSVEERRETFTKTRFKNDCEKLTQLEKELKEKHSQSMGSLVRYEDYKRLEKEFFQKKIKN